MRGPVGLAQHRLPARRRYLREGRQRAPGLGLCVAHAVDVDRREARGGEREAWGGGWARTRGATPERRHRHRVRPRVRAIRTASRSTTSATRGPRTGARASGVQPGLGYTADDRSRQRHRQRLAVSGGAAAGLAALRQGRRCSATYIPTLGGGINHGSVFYVFGKIAPRLSGTADERPRHRRRRPRARARVEARAVAAGRARCSSRRATPAPRASPGSPTSR